MDHCCTTVTINTECCSGLLSPLLSLIGKLHQAVSVCALTDRFLCLKVTPFDLLLNAPGRINACCYVAHTQLVYCTSKSLNQQLSCWHSAKCIYRTEMRGGPQTYHVLKKYKEKYIDKRIKQLVHDNGKGMTDTQISYIFCY